jgi:hypothetical protein
MQEPENIIVKKWEVLSISVEAETPSTWGVHPHLVSLVKDMLQSASYPVSNITGQNSLLFNEFRHLVSFLHNKGYDVSNINIALGKYQMDHPDIEESGSLQWDEQIQQTLKALFSPNTPGPFTIIADGKWNPASESALQYVRDAYYFVPKERNEALVRCLESIAQKIVRLNCADDWLLTHVEHNPFCIVNDSDGELELKRQGNGASVYETETRKDLVHFHSFVSANKRGLPSYNQFSAWFLLLNIPSMNFEKVGRLQIQQKNGWLPLGQLNKESNVEYIQKPDYIIRFSDFMVNCRVVFSSPTEEPVDIFGIYFSGDFRYTLITGYDNTAPEGMEGSEKYFDAEYFYRNLNYLKNREADAYTEYRADYFKIFVVKKGVLDVPSETHQSKAVADVDIRVQKLITTASSDIYYCYTIGLELGVAEKKPLPPFNNKWILVAGTGSRPLNNEEHLVTEAVGKALAEHGYGLINGGWPGVDELASKCFMEVIGNRAGQAEERLLHLLEPETKASNLYGRIETISLKQNWYVVAAKKAYAAVLIGGEGGTMDIYNTAKETIPILPIFATGGDAGRVYKGLQKNKSARISKDMLALLKGGANNKDDAAELAAGIIEILSEVDKKSKRSLSEQEFKKEVESIYNSRKVVVPDDLQKNRWGGYSATNAKMIEAYVNEAKTKGLFNLEIIVQLKDADSASSWVAFFLHDSFPQEIIYKKAVKGIAEIKVTTYEAFTVGAYTEDGTMLELDMQREAGFPPAFYYEAVTDSFKEKVEKVLASRKITVPDDLQKNRWGSKQVGNGKMLTASVKADRASGLFVITAEVKSEKEDHLLIGDVAFFLHNSFPQQIRYKNAGTGAASITINSHGSFTLGAYTEDGTMLELDLQQQKGYPREFYHKEKKDKPPRTGKPPLKKK